MVRHTPILYRCATAGAHAADIELFIMGTYRERSAGRSRWIPSEDARARRLGMTPRTLSPHMEGAQGDCVEPT